MTLGESQLLHLRAADRQEPPRGPEQEDEPPLVRGSDVRRVRLPPQLLRRSRQQGPQVLGPGNCQQLRQKYVKRDS